MDIGNIYQGIKQGMANQGARNIADEFSPHTPNKFNIESARNIAQNFPAESVKGFFNTPMAIPALGGAVGTGVAMATGSGLALGAAARYIIKQHLKTKILQEQAKQAKMYADVLERAGYGGINGL